MTTALITIDDRYAVTIEIPETKDGEEGKLHSYSIAPCPVGFDVFACQLTRLDTGAERRVALDVEGKWRCNCEDRFYRPRRRGGCKHMRHIRAIWRLWQSLTPKEPPPPSTETRHLLSLGVV
jgi:hypothetical protein